MRVPKLAFIQTSFSGLQRWCSSARLIWWLITLPFHFPLSFLKPLSNKPVHDLPICSGELGRQKARFCCLGCKVARFPVLNKGVMHQKIQVLAGVFACNVLVWIVPSTYTDKKSAGNKCAGNKANPPCALPSTSGKGSQYRFGHCSGLCHFSTITCAPMLLSHWWIGQPGCACLTRGNW